MKKILSLTTILLLVLMILIPVMAEPDYTLDGGQFEFNMDTPLGSAPNVIGSETYQDIEAPLTPMGLISTAAQTNDTANIIVLTGVASVALAGVCFIAFKAKKKSF